MNKKWKVILCAVITVLAVSTFPLAAQTFSTAQSSRTSEATAGLFGTDVDDFLSYHYYGGVEFDKWFSYAGWRTLGTNNLLSAGYARRFGNVYTALAYTGNIVSNANVTLTKTNTATYDADGVNTQTVTSESGQSTTAVPRNQIDLLLGLAGMGIKVGFAEDLTITNNPAASGVTVINQKTEYPDSKYAEHRNIVDSYRNINGGLAPYLGWGMGLALGSIKIRPYVNLSLAIHQDELLDIRKSFNTIDGTAVGERISVINSTAINPNAKYGNFIQPDIALGAGFVLKDNGTVEIDAGLGYGIGFRLYNNTFDVFGISGSTPGKVTNLTGTYRITEGAYGAREYHQVAAYLTEETYSSHVISPSFTYYQSLADNVRIGINVSPSFTIESEKTLGWSETTTKTYNYPTYQGANRASTVVEAITGKGETDKATFIFAPAISGGVKYTLAPNRFVLNAGLTAKITYTGITTTTKPAGFGRTVSTATDESGNVVETVNYAPAITTTQTDSVATSSVWSGLSATASGGFTLYFTPKFALDTAFTYATAGGSVGLDTIALLFSLKN
jgi:hypothetical protein